MYEDMILEIIEHVKDDIEVDKLKISKIRKEKNKIKKYIKDGQDLEINNEELEEELLIRENKIISIKEKISNEKKAIYRLNKAMNLLK